MIWVSDLSLGLKCFLFKRREEGQEGGGLPNFLQSIRTGQTLVNPVVGDQT